MTPNSPAGCHFDGPSESTNNFDPVSRADPQDYPVKRQNLSPAMIVPGYECQAITQVGVVRVPKRSASDRDIPVNWIDSITVK